MFLSVFKKSLNGCFRDIREPVPTTKKKAKNRKFSHRKSEIGLMAKKRETKSEKRNRKRIKARKSTMKSKGKVWLKKSKNKRKYVDYDAYMVSSEWKAVRQKAFAYHGKYCADCKTTKRLTVHHKTYKRLGNERMTDLMVLCWGCHKRLHERMDAMKECPKNVKEWD